MATNTKRLTTIVLGVLGLLSVPLIAMQFTNEVNWSLFDFMVAGILLLSTGLIVNFAFNKIANKNKRTLVITGVLIVLAVVWVELAVGLFGSPIAGS